MAIRAQQHQIIKIIVSVVSVNVMHFKVNWFSKPFNITSFFTF